MRLIAFLILFVVGCSSTPTTNTNPKPCEEEYRVLTIYCFNYHGGSKANNLKYQGELPEMCKKWARKTAPSCPD